MNGQVDKLLLTGVASGALALALTACGSTDSPETAEAEMASPVKSKTQARGAESEQTAATKEKEKANSLRSSADDRDRSPRLPGHADQLATGPVLHAADTATNAVAGSRLLSVDREPWGWDVQVVTGDGVEREFHLNRQGDTVLRGPTAQPDDPDDRWEHQKLLRRADIGHREAAGSAMREHSGARVADMDLEHGGGRVMWEVQLTQPTMPVVTVHVDAASGRVLWTDLDD